MLVAALARGKTPDLNSIACSRMCSRHDKLWNLPSGLSKAMQQYPLLSASRLVDGGAFVVQVLILDTYLGSGRPLITCNSRST